MVPLITHRPLTHHIPEAPTALASKRRWTARRRGRAWELRRAGRATANEKKHGIVRRPDSVEAAEAWGRRRDPLNMLLEFIR